MIHISINDVNESIIASVCMSVCLSVCLSVCTAVLKKVVLPNVAILFAVNL